MARRFATGSLPPASQLFPTINAQLNVNTSPTSIFTGKTSKRVITIPELSHAFKFKWGAFPEDNTLETLFAISPPQLPVSNPQYDLTNFNVSLRSSPIEQCSLSRRSSTENSAIACGCYAISTAVALIMSISIIQTPYRLS